MNVRKYVQGFYESNPRNNILIVEDNTEWQDIISTECSELTNEVEVASYYPIAKKYLLDNKFALCIIDLNLGDSKQGVFAN